MDSKETVFAVFAEIPRGSDLGVVTGYKAASVGMVKCVDRLFV